MQPSFILELTEELLSNLKIMPSQNSGTLAEVA